MTSTPSFAFTVAPLAAIFLAACAESGAGPGGDAAVAADVPEPPPPDAGFLPALECVPPVFAEIVAGSSTRARVRCEARRAAVIDDLAVAAPFTATTAAALAIDVVFAPSRAEVGEHRATLLVRYAADGETEDLAVDLVATALAPLEWDPLPADPPCRADRDAPLLDEALAAAGLDRGRFGFTAADLQSSSYHRDGHLADEALLSWFAAARAAPHRAGCLEGRVAGVLDQLLDRPHPVADAIRHAAKLLDRPVPEDVYPFDRRALPGSFGEAIAALCAGRAAPCAAPEGILPGEVEAALAPILWAIAAGLDTRAARDPAAARHDAGWWQSYGGDGLLISNAGERYELTDDLDRAYLIGTDRAALYGAAAQIAHAIEHTEWTAVAGMMDVQYDLQTGAGAIRVRDSGTQRYREDGEPVLLLLDLGGDDVHLDEVASNRSGRNAVSVAIDLAGSDRYEYEPRATAYDREGLLPADNAGRYRGDASYGNVTFSRRYRQGAARNGIAMLFDLGTGNDHYQSLTGSQGYAHQGAGVLFDGGGDDTYLAEQGAQGSAQFGIGLLVDAGAGDDVRRAFAYAQGFGFAQGAGFLIDGGGADSYTCDHGDPSRGGIPLYYSPQLPNTGNTSMCQGAGYGRRGQEPRTYLSGGVGVLRDAGGDDRYEASVFAQGTGYWQGTGILSDGGGSDRFDAYWYVQGGAAHYAIGVLGNAGDGTDVFNGAREAINMHLGAGHDFSAGVYVGESGNSEYHLAQLSAGASHCNGVGLFVDNGGNDRYAASSDYGSGSGSVGEECRMARPDAVSIGVMIDAGGADEYTYPMSAFPIPMEGGSWGHARAALPSEHGAGIDGDGETGIHSER